MGLKVWYMSFFGLAALALYSCGTRPQITPEGPHWVDEEKSIDKPEATNSSLAWDAVDNTLFDQALQGLNIERDFRIITGNRRESRNINAFDEVPNSSWFTNRHHLFPLTEEDLTRGVNTSDGPDTSGTWLVFRPKVGGATPGFWIEDARGDQYILKFDPPENPELATGAAAIGSRYFYACGYNVPQETIVHWHPDKLRIKEGVTYRPPGGERMPFTRQVLDSILVGVHRQDDGTIRSLASRALPNVIGPFSYKGRRSDDPNDWCPHQDRRELRALYVIASLVNHYDTKDQNTLTTYETVDGKNVVMHYLIDFGSVLGSDGDNAKGPKQGYANLFDLRDAIVSLFTLGLKTWGWQHAEPSKYPSIGYFESKIFEPDKFDPIQPNPAFEEMTRRDAYWGARIVMSFDESDIRALVQAGQYSNKEAEEYLIQTLLERREKIGRYWFSKVNPLDEFVYRYTSGKVSLRFNDLAVKYGLEPTAGNEYRYSVMHDGKTIIPARSISNREVMINGKDLDAMRAAFSVTKAETDHRHRLYQIEMVTKRPETNWSKPTVVWLALNPVDNSFSMVGIEHLD
jgi:hypothetical protein